MNSFNYFSLYHDTKRGGKGFSVKKAARSALLLTLLCLLVYGFVSFQTLQRKSQLALLAEIKMDEGFNRAYTATTQVESLVKATEQEALFLEQLGVYCETLDTGNFRLTEVIDACVPEHIQLSRIGVSGKQVTLEGYAPSVDTLTAIERSFRETGYFEFVLVSTLENNPPADRALKFACLLTLDGGAIPDENKP